MSTQETIDLSKLSAKDLQAELQRREKEETQKKQEAINAHNKAKEAYVNDTIEEFKRIQESLTRLKQIAITNGNRLYTEMFEVYGKEPKKQKQFSLTNEAKTRKVVVDNAETVGFGDEAVVAINAIKDFFKNKFESRSKLVYSLLDTLLIKNGKGDYDPKLLTKLRAQVREIDDERLTEAFQLLENSQVVTGRALYLRAYEVDEKGKMKDIVIQFSSL